MSGNSKTGAFVRAAKAADLPEGAARSVMVDGKAVALFKTGGRVRALDDVCPHMGGPLGEGSLDGAVVTCPWHAWQFDVESGACRADDKICARRYEVKLEGEDILVSL